MNVYLKGFCSDNLGDDLFIHILLKRYPQHTFWIVMNSGFGKAISNNRNVRIIQMNKIKRVINKILCKIHENLNIYHYYEKKSDLSIVIGGSMFQEFPYDKDSINRLRSFPGKCNKTYIIGANFGPYQTKEYYHEAEKYFSNMEDICFRDYYSYNHFKNLNNVRYAPDIVFNLNEDKKSIGAEKKYCVISVMDFKKKPYLIPYAIEYKQFIIHAIEHYLSNNYEVALVSFCKIEGDENAIQQIMNDINVQSKDKIHIIKYDGTNLQMIIKLFQHASYVIASRFHSMILGFNFQVPTLPIIYNNKCLHVLQDLNCEAKGIDLSDLKSFSIDHIEYIVLDDIHTIKKLAQNQFKELDQILE